LRLSVVIPTFNRGPALAATVERVLRSDVGRFSHVEIAVVDDGSTVPADTHLAGLTALAPIALRVIRQENAGPAKARNAGFRATSGDIVLFLDDDILLSPGLLRGHAEAHQLNPGAVICGRCPWVPPRHPGAVFRMLSRLGYDPASGSGQPYIPLTVVASGHISVERTLFDLNRGVYRDDLKTPAAEEYELSHQLRCRQIPILLASELEALHDSPTNLAALCRQQFKHGVGCGEVARRCPEALAIAELAHIVRTNSAFARPTLRDRVSTSLKTLAATPAARALALAVGESAEALAPQADVLSPLYRLAIASHFTGGVREGLRRYGEASRC